MDLILFELIEINYKTVIIKHIQRNVFIMNYMLVINWVSTLCTFPKKCNYAKHRSQYNNSIVDVLFAVEWKFLLTRRPFTRHCINCFWSQLRIGPNVQPVIAITQSFDHFNLVLPQISVWWILKVFSILMYIVLYINALM